MVIRKSIKAIRTLPVTGPNRAFTFRLRALINFIGQNNPISSCRHPEGDELPEKWDESLFVHSPDAQSGQDADIYRRHLLFRVALVVKLHSGLFKTEVTVTEKDKEG